MAETPTKAERRARMALVRGKDTGPEMVVPRLVHGLGYRYRLHVAELPGKPDMVFPGRAIGTRRAVRPPAGASPRHRIESEEPHAATRKPRRRRAPPRIGAL